MSGERFRVLIPTTTGLVEVLLLMREDPVIGRSVACIGGTTEIADIAAAYQAFVASPTGVIERLFGHPCYRLDVSGRIDAGASWQLGALAAHALHAADRLTQENDAADGVVWASGSVRPVDLTVGSVGHIEEKLAQSLPRLKREVQAGRRVVLAVPTDNAASLAAGLAADCSTQGIEVLALADARALCERLGVTLPEATWRATADSAAERQAAPRSLRLGRRGLWTVAAALLMVVAVAAYQLAWRPATMPEAQINAGAPREMLVPETTPYIASRDQAAIRAVYMSSPGHKAIAVNTTAIGVAVAQQDREAAIASARASCQRGEGAQPKQDPCEIYAVDNEVVFARGRPPLPPRPWIIDDPITARPFVLAEVPFLTEAQSKRVGDYARESSPKALAIGEKPVFVWHAYQASVDDAARRALERCGTASGTPCTIVAVNDSFVVPIPRTAKPVAIARVETMNAIAPELRRPLTADLRAVTSGWNAIAVGTKGQIGTRLGAKSEREAVDGAMAECDRKDRGCRVMVIGPFLVEPLPATQAGNTAARRTSASAKPEALLPLLAALSSAAPALEEQIREAARQYVAAKPHKALALVPGTNRYSFDSDFPNAERAEEFVLETCQLLHGVPCTLVALDGVVQPIPANGEWQTNDMPRLRYAGQFDPERIPGLPRLGHQLARRVDIALYGAASGPKAAAMHGNDGGRLFIVMTASTQGEAESRALSDCNADPARAGVTCYLYAVGDRVVFSEHRSETATR